jgi:hypothetical protein
MITGKHGLIALSLAVAELTASAQVTTREHLNRVQHLGDVIQGVSLLIQLGGASIEDAANLLRDKIAFPVALEMHEFDRPSIS